MEETIALTIKTVTFLMKQFSYKVFKCNIWYWYEKYTFSIRQKNSHSTIHITLHGSWILAISGDYASHISQENPSCQASIKAFVSEQQQSEPISIR